MPQILPFILCGGAGTRLWPLSREAYPKQFHRLTGPDTLFQQTCQRLTGPRFGDLYVLSNHRHRFLVADQLEEIGAQVAHRDRARGPQHGAGGLHRCADRRGREPNALVLLAPSDHMVGDKEGFARAIESGVAAAEAGGASRVRR